MIIEDEAISPYQIEVDDSNFTVKELHIITAGKGFGGKEIKKENIGQTRETLIGHYGTLQSALKSIAKLKVLEVADRMTIAEYISIYNENLENFSKLITI